MNSIFYSVITLLLLTCGVLLLMHSANKNRNAENGYAENQPEILSKEEGEDHFSVLMNSITPVWYWRVNHEYIDFIHSTIKRMTMVELNETRGNLMHSGVAAISTLRCINITTILKNAA